MHSKGAQYLTVALTEAKVTTPIHEIIHANGANMIKPYIEPKHTRQRI